MKPKATTGQIIKRNLALRTVRRAMKLRQPGFAALIGFSPSTVTSIETGSRKATVAFANAVAGKTGAHPASILEHAEVALDYRGEPYSAESYRIFRETKADEISAEDIEELLRPIRTAFLAAADAGRLRLFAYLLKLAVIQTAEIVDGVKSAVANRLSSEAGIKLRYTIGDMRNNTPLAKALGFQDSPDLDDTAIFVDVELKQHAPITRWFSGARYEEP